MSNILSSDDFGLKIYNRFPPVYREEDAKVNFALKRYLQALSDGGFKYAIDEINGITALIDPNTALSKALPILFKQYGLEIFNGIPEPYLRYLLPKLGEAWSKKGSLSVVEFITSSLSGIKTSTIVEYDEEENPTVGVRLEMDYNIGDYFPEASQFSRLLRNFVPFYCDLNLIYSYLFFENDTVVGTEGGFKYNIKHDPAEDVLAVGTQYTENNAIVSTISESAGVFIPSENNALTNRLNYTLNNTFCTNALYSYDTVWIRGVSQLVLY